MALRVLMTRGLSNVRDAIELIHQAMAPGEFHLGATYFTEHTPLRHVGWPRAVFPGGESAYGRGD